MNSKRKRIVSAMLIMTMSTTLFSTNVFAGGGASCISVECEGLFKGCCRADDDEHGQTPTTPSSITVNGSGNNVVNGSGNNIVINHIQTQGKKEGHLVIGKEIENKTIEDIAPIPIDKIQSVTIKDGVKKIRNAAFAGCTGLTSISIPASVTEISECAFDGCTGLTSIIIPDSVTEIGGGAFAFCTGLTSINVDTRNPKYKSIDGVLFSKDGTKLIQYPANKMATNYIIPDSVKEIDGNAFIGCTSLTSITIPDSVTKIGILAFSGCTGLTSINIPDSVTEIGHEIFEGCTGLTSYSIDGILFSNDKTKLIKYPAGRKATNYIIPNSVKSIGEQAFCKCTSLKEVTIPNSVTFISEKAFDGCTSLTSINVDKGNQYYKSNGGILFSKDKTKLIKYPAGRKVTNYIIPDSVTKIDDYAFIGCTRLTSISIPNSVEDIGEGAFYGCTGLTSISIPNSVTSIGYEAFCKCESLTSVTIPNSIKKNRARVFIDCPNLQKVKVCRNAFAGCTK